MVFSSRFFFIVSCTGLQNAVNAYSLKRQIRHRLIARLSQLTSRVEYVYTKLTRGVFFVQVRNSSLRRPAVCYLHASLSRFALIIHRLRRTCWRSICRRHKFINNRRRSYTCERIRRTGPPASDVCVCVWLPGYCLALYRPIAFLRYRTPCDTQKYNY